jgi:alpha-ribazole phosphatase
MIKIVLIRHGKTLGNVNKAYIGLTDELLCYDSIAEIYNKKYPFIDEVFSSPLKRCTQTANLIYPHKIIQIKNNLRECNFGDFEGKNYEQLKENLDYKKWLNSNGTIAFPNGEDGYSFRKRSQKEFENIINESISKNFKQIAIVCHGGTIMAILDKFSYPNKKFYNWQVENLGGFIFCYNDKSKRAVNIKKLFCN